MKYSKLRFILQFDPEPRNDQDQNNNEDSSGVDYDDHSTFGVQGN